MSPAGGRVHRGAVGQPSSSSNELHDLSPPEACSAKYITVEGSIPVGAFRRFHGSQNMAGRSNME